MRVTRAFVGSVGAGLCLVAAAVTVLFVLSAVVAVRGWPGIDPENDLKRVTLAESSLASADAAVRAVEPAAVAASADAPAPIVLGGAPSGGDDGGSGTAPRRPGTRRQTATGDGTPPAGTTPGPAAPQQAGTTSPSAPGSDAPALVGDPVAETIRDTGETAGGVTDPVAPGSGPAVTQVTDTVADAVEGTNRAVEKAAQGDVPGAVDEVTDAVGGLLGDS